jgi:predicted ribosome quality control (RQC) complex YloA/Tae2 family protein
LKLIENARIEKEIKKQKVTHDEDISLLKERISYLEDEKESLKKYFKDLTSTNNKEMQRFVEILNVRYNNITDTFETVHIYTAVHCEYMYSQIPGCTLY